MSRCILMANKEEQYLKYDECLDTYEDLVYGGKLPSRKLNRIDELRHKYFEYELDSTYENEQHKEIYEGLYPETKREVTSKQNRNDNMTERINTLNTNWTGGIDIG